MKSLFQRIDGISVKMLLSYFSILLVPLCVIVIIYNTSMDAILASRQETALNALKETSSIMTARLEELGNISSYIYTDANTNAIINRSRFEAKSRNIYTFYQAINALPSYKLTNQMIEDIFIFFNTADFIIKQPSAFAFTRENYDSHVHFHGISYEEILELCSRRYMGTYMVRQDDTGRDVLLLRSLPNTTEPEGLIAIQINLDTVHSIMSTNDVGPGGSVLVLTRDGDVFTQVGTGLHDMGALQAHLGKEAPACAEIQLDGSQYLLCQVHEGSLSYVALTEKGHLLAGIAPIRTLIALLGAAALLVGSLICIALWRRRSRVVKSIASTARSAGVDLAPAISEQQMLEVTVNTLASTVDTLRGTMDMQRGALNQTVVQACLAGSFPSRTDMMREVSALKLDLIAPYYHVVRVSLLDPWESPTETDQILPYRIFLKQFFDANLHIPHVISDMDIVSFALLLTEQEMRPAKELASLFHALSAQVGQRDWEVPSFAISDCGTDLWSVHSLYRQTEEITGYMALLERRGVFSAADLPAATDAMYFPMEMEIRLIQVMQNGTPEELDALFERIMEENLAQRTLSAAMLGELFEALRRSILRAAESGAMEDTGTVMEMLGIVRSFSDLRGYAGRLKRQMSLASDAQHLREDRQFRQVIVQHIDRQLSNPAFNLSMLAEMVDMPESALYRSFRDCFGISFSTYLEQRRINLAFELLKNQALIKDVAASVGYTSDHTFRRAFKRVMKVPPSQFARLGQSTASTAESEGEEELP